MILLLDIGNTRIKWAQLLDGALTPQQALVHKDMEAEAWIKQLFRERFRPARLLVANVAGSEMAARITQEAQRLWQIKPEFAASTSVAAGVTNAYADVSALGVDRWLAVLAAYKRAGGAACVIDAGTAVTIDAVNSVGLHLGGLILPGIQMMMDALLDRTSDIARKARKFSVQPAANTSGRSNFFGSSTPQAVANGALFAVAAAADRAIVEAGRQTQIAPKIYLTGGDAERLEKAMQTRGETLPDLVLQGLAILAQAA